jgi:hypothetical protein
VVSIHDENQATWPGHSHQFCKRQLRIWQVDKDSIGVAAIKGSILKRKVLDASLHKAEEQTRILHAVLRLLDHDVAHIQTHDLAAWSNEFRYLLCILTGPRSGIEHLLTGMQI